MTDFIVIIPARLKSTRLPEKLLKIINSKPLLYYTYQNALKSGAKKVLIATDSPKIIEVMQGFDAECVLTSENHTSGTSRLAEVIKTKNIDKNQIIVNLQGDEPLLPAKVIEQVAINLAKNEVDVATICENITSIDDYNNPNCVKVVKDKSNLAMYFSRAQVPFFRDEKPNLDICFKHIGIYAYRAGFIEKYLNLSGIYENIEKLEQLTILENGFKIHIEKATQSTGIGVDTDDDLTKVRKIFNDN